MLKINNGLILGAGLMMAGTAFAGGDPATMTDSASADQTQSESQNAPATTSSASAQTSAGQTSQAASNASASEQANSAAQQQPNEDVGFDAVEDDELVIDTGTIDDGDGLGSLQVQWQISGDGTNWSVLPGAIQNSFTPRDSEVGKFLRVQISYVDGQGNTEMLFSPMSTAVQNVNDKPIGRPELKGVAVEDSTLVVDTSRISDDDGLGAFSLIWQRSSERTNWENFPDQFGDSIQLSQSDVGFSYRAVVSYIDGFGTRETLVTDASEAVANIDNPLQGEVTVRGKELEGAELLVNTSTLYDFDGIASITVDWESSTDGRTWRSIDGMANARSLKLAQSLVGNAVRVRATVVDNFGAEYVVTSRPTGNIRNVNDRPAGKVLIRRISN